LKVGLFQRTPNSEFETTERTTSFGALG